MTAKDVRMRILGPGVKGSKVEWEAGRYHEAAFVTLHRKDPHLGGKTKLVNLFNEALTQADKLNLPLKGLAPSLRDLVEGSGFVDGRIGRFILEYGRFEGRFNTTGASTCQAMRRLAGDDDYLDSLTKNGNPVRYPAPYAIRNWLAHLGSSQQGHSDDDVNRAYELLLEWNKMDATEGS